MDDFKKLRVWTRAYEVALEVYKVSRCLPREELYGLTSQMRRAAASIGANIAEGCGRRSDGDMSRFLRIARGSATELEFHMLLARDLGFLAEDQFREITGKVDETQRMLTALIERLEKIRKALSSGSHVVP
jgi:four helix bundle protein